MLAALPHKTKFICPASSLLSDEDCVIHKKTKLISMVYSNKKEMAGHQLRHTIADHFLSNIGYNKMELYGSGCSKPIKTKAEGTIHFMFQIAIENAKRKNYFSDKIMDCFVCGTIPVYWGCDNIGDFFDKRGILTFDTLGELEDVLHSLDEKKYFSMLKYAKINYETCVKNYLNFDDNIIDIISNFLMQETNSIIKAPRK